MTTQELIDARKRRILLSIRGYDQTLKLNGKMSLVNIINFIDKSSVPSGDDMADYISGLYNKTTAVLKFASTVAMRKNKRAFQWLQSEHNTQEVWESIRMYATLGHEVYTITEEAMQFMYDKLISKDADPYKYVLFNNEHDFEAKQITLRVGDMLYSALVPTRIASMKRGKSEIQLAVAFGDNFEPIATYNYTLFLDSFNKDGVVTSEREDLGIVCSNKECPYHKASLSPEYSDGSKRVDCTAQDCSKCKAFGNDVLAPLDLLNAVATVIYSYENRQKTTRVINDGTRVDYEPLPLPMCDTPVIIYTDSVNDNEVIVRTVKHSEDYIPGTHASPREHSRAAHKRFNPRTGKKDINVKGCTVNKGYAKTTYEIKTHKRKKVEVEPEITLKGQSMINELLSQI